MMRRLTVIPITLLMLVLTGCPLQQTSTLPAATNGGGYILSTGYIDSNTMVSAPETTASGVWQSDGAGAAGDPSSFTVTTDGQGLFGLINGRVNATWLYTWIGSLSTPSWCNGVTALGTPSKDHLEEFNCLRIGLFGEAAPSAFTFSPDPLNPVNMPATSTITGSGFSSSYGMPVVQYFDMNGNLIAQQSASSVSADGTTLSFPSPPITEMNAGTYAGIISNIAENGSYQYVGTTAVDVSTPMYRPTQYSDAGGDPTLYPTWVYTGSDATLESYTNYNLQPGAIYVADVENGDCTWFGFPSHVDTNNLTIYIPYTTSAGGYYQYFNMEVDVTIGGKNTVLFANSIVSQSGVLSATIPAGTDISTVQAHIDISTFDDGLGNPLDNSTATAAVNVYIQ